MDAALFAPAVDWSPVLGLLLAFTLVAGVPLALWAWRQRHATPRARWHALAVLAVFLTFDLILFGAFTRLTDSGLGCPDWPGCYGRISPLGAHSDIAAAQAAMPHGPVTHGKAWIEMLHRYFAGGVGLLIVVLALLAWRARWRQDTTLPAPGAPTLALGWVLVQGAFGAWTVTLRLMPAIVTLHLLLALGLLMLLTHLAVRSHPLALPALYTPGQRRAIALVLLLVLVQAALGGWVSTNYAVLACRDFPTCQGQWWPPMDFAHGFALWRELGAGRDGGFLPFAALTAIHMTHRVFAVLVLAALLVLAWQVRRAGPRHARLLALGAAWQLLSGLSNVVLGWPLLAALAHTGGAAALLALLTALLARPARARGS